MIYRKAPPQPGRLLLRVVAVAGAGAVLGVVACSSGSSGLQQMGFAANPDAGGDSGDSGFMGATDGGGSDVLNGFVDAGGGIMGATDGGVCEEGCGLVGNPDAEADVITGVVVHPDGGTD
jgi:hypothetical protein